MREILSPETKPRIIAENLVVSLSFYKLFDFGSSTFELMQKLRTAVLFTSPVKGLGRSPRTHDFLHCHTLG